MALKLVQVAEDELELVASISQMWSDLFTESRHVDRSLTAVKKSFTKVRLQIKRIKDIFCIFVESHFCVPLIFFFTNIDNKGEDRGVSAGDVYLCRKLQHAWSWGCWR